jgi:uncharacterized membrane protein
MHDPLWMRAFLAIHIAAGTSAFVLAPLALITAKGGKAHRRWGKIYFWAMAVVAVTAMVMAIYRPILFLALVAIFSFYSAFTGYRVLGQKAAYKGEKTATALDWFAAGFTFVASALLAFFGAVKPALVQNLGIPAIVFGCIGMWIAATTAWAFTHRPKEKMFWWYAHLSGMLGSYIAAWTAFSVVTIGPLLHGAWWIWVVPTGIGVPAIVMTRGYYHRKFTPKPKINAPATA